MDHAEQRYVGEILVRQGALTQDRMQAALSVAEERGARLQDVLIATDAVDEERLLRALADELGLEVVLKIQSEDIPQALIDAVPINFARQHRLLPIAERDGSVLVATSDLLDLSPLDDLRALMGRPVEPVAVPSDVVDDAINRVYDRKDENALAEAQGDNEDEELQDLIDMTDEAPVIRWVNNLFYKAVQDRASDIHIEPTDNEVVVRYRIDGQLFPVKTAHRGFLPSIVSRVKIEAGLNIAEKRLPQDGRITKKIRGKLIDIRVSTVPTAKGERVVLRMLDKEQVMLDLSDLGFAPDNLQTLAHYVERPNGIVLVTGPTGSGKTTTLYACLNRINSPDLNILTIEDPVEYELRGIGQVHVQPKIGLTFASGLRAFLRQDPDVIMVGEIRDHETAEIAIHASLTGHLVLSTLHTNDAAGAVTRLVEMGVQPYLISSSLLAVLAQRLVRRLCPTCRSPYFPGDDDLLSLGLDPSRYAPAPMDPTSATEIAASQGAQPLAFLKRDTGGDHPDGNSLVPRPVFFRSVGCDACVGTGYRGRKGIYELLVVDEPVRGAIVGNKDSREIHRIAARRGMRSLRQDGARQVLAGVTSLEEVLAATQAGEME